MLKTYWLQVLFIAFMVQMLSSCSSTTTSASKKEEDVKTVKKRVPFSYHKHFDDK